MRGGQAPLLSSQATLQATLQASPLPPSLTLSSAYATYRDQELSALVRLASLWGRGGGVSWRRGWLFLSARALEASAWSLGGGQGGREPRERPLVGALTLKMAPQQGQYRATLYSLNLRGGRTHTGLTASGQRAWSPPHQTHTLSAEVVATPERPLAELSVSTVSNVNTMSAWGAPTLSLSGRWVSPHPLTQLVAPWSPWPERPLDELTHLKASLDVKRARHSIRALTLSLEAQEGGALTWMSDTLTNLSPHASSARALRGALSAQLSSVALPQLSLTPSLELWKGTLWGEQAQLVAGELGLTWRPQKTPQAQGVTLWGGVSPLGRLGGGARAEVSLIGVVWGVSIERPRLINHLLPPPSPPSSPLWRALLSARLPWRAVRSSRASP